MEPGHLVWFVLSLVAELDTAGFHRRDQRSSAGRAGYDPDMLLALLIYAYCTGVRSSRQIERLCGVDVAFRVLCGQDVPDHTVLARFRARHDAAFEQLFTQVLMVAARAGLGRFATVAIDGTKIAADASLLANRSEQWLREQVAGMLAEAAATDAAEDELFGPDRRGDELPPELADPVRRCERIRAALAQVEADKAASEQDDAERAAAAEQRMQALQAGQRPVGRDPRQVDPIQAAQARLERELAAQQAKLDAAAARQAAAAAAGEKIRGGRPPASLEQGTAAIRRARQGLARAHQVAADRSARPASGPLLRGNITDPASRIMPTRGGWVQGYNVQFAVTADQLIIAAEVGQNPVDAPEFTTMMEAATAATRLWDQHNGSHPRIGTVLADAGYLSAHNLAAPGPDRLIALGKSRSQYHAAAEHPADGDPPADATAIEAMHHRLRTPTGIELYKRRGATVEPAIGNFKKIMNRCSRRGLSAVTGEINLAATVFNILKIYRAAAP